MIENILHYTLIFAMFVLAVSMAASMIRTFIGPTITDRLLAVNMINTQVILFLLVLSLYLGEGYLVDVAIVYALIGFLAVVVLTKVYIGVDKENKLKQLHKEAFENTEE